MHFFSRTRGPWRKGETSGNTLRVVSLAAAGACSLSCRATFARTAPRRPGFALAIAALDSAAAASGR